MSSLKTAIKTITKVKKGTDETLQECTSMMMEAELQLVQQYLIVKVAAFRREHQLCLLQVLGRTILLPSYEQLSDVADYIAQRDFQVLVSTAEISKDLKDVVSGMHARGVSKNWLECFPGMIDDLNQHPVCEGLPRIEYYASSERDEAVGEIRFCV